MKIVICSDLHFGIKNFSLSFLDKQLEFFERQFFPFIEQYQPDYIIQTGDLFDNRKIFDINFYHVIKERFFKRLKNYPPFIVLLGNHDIYWKNRKDINTLNLFGEYITIIEAPTLLENVILYPWLTPSENIDKCILKKGEYVIGHFEIKDFEILRGVRSQEGLEPSIFPSNIKRVLSGHYHINSFITNPHNKIIYLGTPYQLNWNDFNDIKGFYILDTKNNTIEFIENKITPKFIKIIITDKIKILGLGKVIELNDYNDIPLKIKENYIKIINYNKTEWFDEIMYFLKDNQFVYDLIDNSQIEEILELKEDLYIKDSNELLINTIKEQAPYLLPKVKALLEKSEQI